MPRKPPRSTEERLVRAQKSMMPGTLGGRVASAAPMALDVTRLDPRLRAAHETSGGGGGGGLTCFYDEFTTASATLTYIPYGLTGIYVNGRRLFASEYTIDYSTGAVAYSGSFASGDRFQVDYLTLSRTLGAPAYVGTTADGGSGTVATGTVPSGIVAGDLLIFALATHQGFPGTPTTPSGWSLLGTDTDALTVFTRTADGTETSASTTMPGTSDWATIIRAYRGTGVSIHSNAFGATATSSTSCTSPTTSAAAPMLVEIFAAWGTFGTPPGIGLPGTATDVSVSTYFGRQVGIGDELVAGVTTPARTASASSASGWGAAVLTIGA